MRISAERSSPYWAPLAERAVVLVDGIKWRYVVEADEEGGWVRELVRGADGRVVQDGTRDLTTVRHGRVTIVDPDA